jgi:3-hydroxyacyl-[acyl-carrier-protein] dehydratase
LDVLRRTAVAAKDLILDFSEFDLDHVVADLAEIRRHNPQRHEMEQLTAIVYDDPQRHICVGYKDITPHEFWVRGHMPGLPLMPGVLMCEAAAQMCSFHVQKHSLLGSAIVGFGGLEDVHFRDVVVPGDRLVVAAQLVRIRRGRMIVSHFQGFVRQRLVVDGTIKGIPLPVDLIPGRR